MTDLEKLAIKGVQRCIENFDDYEVYKKLQGALERAGINDEDSKTILLCYNNEMMSQKERLKEALNWLKALNE